MAEKMYYVVKITQSGYSFYQIALNEDAAKFMYETEHAIDEFDDEEFEKLCMAYNATEPEKLIQKESMCVDDFVSAFDDVSEECAYDVSELFSFTKDGQIVEYGEISIP